MIIVSIKIDEKVSEEAVFYEINRILNERYENFEIEVSGKKSTIKNKIMRKLNMQENIDTCENGGKNGKNNRKD